MAQNEPTVRVLMRAGVQNEDGEHMEAGEVHEVSENFGRYLIAGGRAVPAPDEIQKSAPKVQNRDPK